MEHGLPYSRGGAGGPGFPGLGHSPRKKISEVPKNPLFFTMGTLAIAIILGGFFRESWVEHPTAPSSDARKGASTKFD